MSEPVENNELPVCRLCTSTKAGQMQIFGNDSGNKNLARKIKECLPIKVAEDDTLSKTVCDACLAKLEEFYRFRQVCIFAQFTLEQQRQDVDDPSPEPVKDDLESAEDIVERLQAGGDGSALSITPVKPQSDDSLKENNHDLSKIMTGSGALSITPVVHQSESSADDDSQWSPSIPTMPRLADPLPEDYVLMKEETFTLSDHGDILTRLHNYTDQYEFRDRTDSDERKKRRGVFKDADIMESQQAKRFVLPPMWDVFEKQPTRDVTHRRYVISKGSFPCSLCGSCVNFHQQQVLAHERLVVKDDRLLSLGDGQIPDVQFNNAQFDKKIFPKVEIKEEIPEEIDLEQQEEEEEEVELELRMEEQNALQGEILQDLRVNQFSPQSVGEVLHCPQCGKVFPRRSSWRRHMRTHYEGRSFVCPLCGKGFNRKEHLSRHMMSHTGGRPFRCETCFKPFTRKEHLSRHLACNRGCGGAGSQGTLEADTNVPRPHVCDICFQGFVRKEHMMRHRKRAHQQLYALPPPTQEEDDVRLYSCTLCPKRFTRKEHLKRHTQVHISRQEMEAARSPTHRAHFLADAKEVCDGPEQIEVVIEVMEQVEVNIGMLGEDSDVETEQLTANGGGKSGLQSADAKAATSSTTSEVDPENEDLELDDEDLLRMQMNETMRQAREGSAVTMSQTPRCQVCHNTFTRKSHLVRHLRRFHPQVELAYAAAYSLGSGVPTTNPDDSALQGHPGVDEEEDMEDENVNALPRNGPIVYGATKSKGGQHPCNLCGKVFGRRYHLVRHRKTQHGVECSKSGRVGRPPKNPPLNSVELSALSMLTFYNCSACKTKFLTADEFKSHSCQNNNNNNSHGEGSSTSNSEVAQNVTQENLLKTKDKPFDCNSCGESFEKQKELNKHVETHVQDLMKDMLWT